MGKVVYLSKPPFAWERLKFRLARGPLLREAYREIEEMRDIKPSVHWTHEDIAYQETGDAYSLWWSIRP